MIRIKFEITFNEKKAGKKLKRLSKSTKGFFSKKLSPALVFSTIILSLVLALGVNFVFAWTDPGADPPGSNVLAPINVSSTAQTKSGDLGVHNLTVNDRHIYLGSQYLYGDNSSALFWTGNHDTVTQMLFRDRQGTTYGRVYGAGDGTWFGLLDGDGNWSYAAVKDTYTLLYINNIEKLRIDNDSLNLGVKEAIRFSDSWLRLNSANSFTSGTYTPYLIRADGGFNVDGNTVIDNNAGWHRTYGNTGWYNGTWHGGWYMIDSTWVRAYNNKSVYTSGSIRADTSLCIGTDCRSSWPSGGGAESDTLDSVCDRGATTDRRIFTDGVTSNGNISVTGAITSTANIHAGSRIISDDTIRGYNDLVLDGSISVGGSVFADNNIKAGGSIVSADTLYANNDLRVNDKIYAPNQGWEDIRNKYPNTNFCGCNDGWYIVGVNFNGDGKCVHVQCASPFKKYSPPNPPGGWNPPCFTAKTQILMANGTSKSIAEVQIGEYVLTRESETSSKLVKAKVLDVYEHETNAYLLVNGYLEVTPHHRMFVNGDWKAAKELEMGDKLLSKNNNEVIVESITAIEERPDIKVYNLEIETYKTYFADGFYVHNIKDNPPPI